MTAQTVIYVNAKVMKNWKRSKSANYFNIFHELCVTIAIYGQFWDTVETNEQSFENELKILGKIVKSLQSW